MKERLLREVVHDNVQTREGRRGTPRRIRTRLHPSHWLALALAIPTLAFVGAWLAGGESGLGAFAMTLVPSRQAPVAIPDRVIDKEAPDARERELFPLDVRRVMIDPGHGGHDPGTRAPGGLEEKEIVLDVALRLRELLEERGYETVMTRETDDFLELDERVAAANAASADVFVSIHVNWLETRNERGIETYYLGPTEDPVLEALARSENRNSGYSLADFRHLLQGVYEQVREDESRELAETVQTSMVRSLRQTNPEIRNRGVKTAPFVVLIGTEMPAVLAEVSCLSNAKEAELLAKPLYRQYIAEALAKGLDGFAAERGTPPVPEPDPAASSIELPTDRTVSSLVPQAAPLPALPALDSSSQAASKTPS